MANSSERVAALVDTATAQGCDRLVVLAPENAYGERATDAVRAKTRSFGGEVVVRIAG